MRLFAPLEARAPFRSPSAAADTADTADEADGRTGRYEGGNVGRVRGIWDQEVR